jgi:hypothetical protein
VDRGSLTYRVVVEIPISDGVMGIWGLSLSYFKWRGEADGRTGMSKLTLCLSVAWREQQEMAVFGMRLYVMGLQGWHISLTGFIRVKVM